MPPNIVPGWPPQRGQRIDQGLFDTYSIGPAAGGPGGGTPGIGNPQMVDPQQRKMLIPPGGGVGGGGGPGPGGGGGLLGGELFGGMGGLVLGGLGHATGAILPGIGMAQGGVFAGDAPPSRQIPEGGIDHSISFGAVDAYPNVGMGSRFPAETLTDIFISPPAPAFPAPPNPQAWTPVDEGIAQTVADWIDLPLPVCERDLTQVERQHVMAAMAAAMEAVSLTSDPQLKERMTELSDEIKKQNAQNDIMVGSDQPTVSGYGKSRWSGATIPGGLPVNAVIWLHKALFEDPGYQRPGTRAFINLLATVVHESRHARGSQDERVPSASTIRALQALRDNISRVSLFSKITPQEKHDVLRAIEDAIAGEESYARINRNDAASIDRARERRVGRGGR